MKDREHANLGIHRWLYQTGIVIRIISPRIVPILAIYFVFEKNKKKKQKKTNKPRFNIVSKTQKHIPVLQNEDTQYLIYHNQYFLIIFVTVG